MTRGSFAGGNKESRVCWPYQSNARFPFPHPEDMLGTAEKGLLYKSKLLRTCILFCQLLKPCWYLRHPCGALHLFARLGTDLGRKQSQETDRVEERRRRKSFSTRSGFEPSSHVVRTRAVRRDDCTTGMTTVHVYTLQVQPLP